MKGELDRDWMASEILDLRDRVSDLEEENRELREAIAASVPYPESWGLTALECKLLHVLRRGNGVPMPRERVMVALYGPAPQPRPEIINVVLCRMKKKVHDYGVRFNRAWGVGYGLTADSLLILDRLAGPVDSRRAA